MHIRLQNKSQKHQEDSNHISHLFWSQWYETRNQLQDEHWKKYKYVEIKQHINEQLMGHSGNLRKTNKIQNRWKHKYGIFEIWTTEIWKQKSMRCSKKQLLEGKFIAIQASLEKSREISNKNFNFTLEGTRKKEQMRVVGAGFRMGNTCKPMVDSYQCMAKPTTIL